MTTKIYSDDHGREIIQFSAGEDGLKLQLWANPWDLDPEEARDMGLVLLKWARDQASNHIKKVLRHRQDKV